MALSSPIRQGRVSFLDHLAKMLHAHFDAVVHEPLPQRWIDLINYLNANEKAQSEGHQPKASPEDR
jgi:hypothetical protein